MPEILRLLHKDYGGIEWFNDKPLIFLSNCLKNSIENELKIPKLIQKYIDQMLGKETSISNDDFEINKKMRSAEEIMKDYGLE